MSDGEICENCKPILLAMQDELQGQRELTRSAAQKLGQARREDPWKRWKEHDQHDRCLALFKLWQRESGHTKSKFTMVRFKLALPFLEEYEDSILVRAILGICRFSYKGNNWWQTLFNESRPDNIERYANEALKLEWRPTLEELADELAKKKI